MLTWLEKIDSRARLAFVQILVGILQMLKVGIHKRIYDSSSADLYTIFIVSSEIAFLIIYSIVLWLALVVIKPVRNYTMFFVKIVSLVNLMSSYFYYSGQRYVEFSLSLLLTILAFIFAYSVKSKLRFAVLPIIAIIAIFDIVFRGPETLASSGFIVAIIGSIYLNGYQFK